jgi:hypothetical protein
MKKIIASSLGIVLAASAVSAFAGKEDRENLAQCKADIESYYGESTRTRLRSIKHTAGETHMRLRVKPQGGENTIIVCSISREGTSSLADGEGVALSGQSTEQKVSYSN